MYFPLYIHIGFIPKNIILYKYISTKVHTMTAKKRVNVEISTETRKKLKKIAAEEDLYFKDVLQMFLEYGINHLTAEELEQEIEKRKH